jgi:hypothetical protein
MEFKHETWTIKSLIEHIEKEKIDLKPPYQRNFIWNSNDQKYLVDSIINNFPLPNFFLYEKHDRKYEMVDGQQRSRTILRFWNGIIYSSKKESINEVDKNKFLEYRLNITILFNLSADDSLEEFYSLVNKRGKHLNTPELFKAQFHDTKFLRLVEELIDNQEMINLNLFSDSTKIRMNDRSFVEELMAYLKLGITDKKLVIEKIYTIDIDENEYYFLKSKFEKVINKLKVLNNAVEIKSTRYKQRNDFYTLFCFINENLDQDDEILLTQYSSLILIDPYISPTNDQCIPLKEYALNCVSQSNSKTARKKRLEFFNSFLKNTNVELNETTNEIYEYLESLPEIKKINKVKIGDYYLLIG